MERRFYGFDENSRTVERRSGGRTASDDNTVTVPGCINTDFCLSSPEDRNDGILTMAFVDMQPLESVYPCDTAFTNGTLFPNIDKPFSGGMYR